MPYAQRILFIGEYGIRNGGENSFLSIASLMQEMGWEFQAAVPVNTDFSVALHEKSIATHDLDFLDENSQRKSQEAIRNDLSNLITEVKPALIHCNSLSTSRLCGPVANELNTPSLGYLRDILKLSRKAISDIDQLDRIIAVSHATKSWHVDQGTTAEKIHVVHNGVNGEHFYPAHTQGSADIKKELGVLPESKLLLFVGQIGMRKAIDVLLKAYFKVASQLDDVHLLIVGERNSTKQEAIEYENRLRESVADSPYSEQVHWLGRRTDVAKIMRESTLLLHPARQEPLGRVLLEASASGIPSITTNVGGSAEIFSGGELETLLCAKDDVQGLADKTVTLLQDKNRRNELGRLCRKMAIQKFGFERCANELHDHYIQLLKN